MIRSLVIREKPASKRPRIRSRSQVSVTGQLVLWFYTCIIALIYWRTTRNVWLCIFYMRHSNQFDIYIQASVLCSRIRHSYHLLPSRWSMENTGLLVSLFFFVFFFHILRRLSNFEPMGVEKAEYLRGKLPDCLQALNASFTHVIHVGIGPMDTCT